MFGRQQQGSVNGNVKALAAAHPWTSAAATAAATAAAGGGALALALLGLRRGRAADALARAAHSWPRVAGGGSGARFAWLVSGSGR